jgi:hypothetical protein
METVSMEWIVTLVLALAAVVLAGVAFWRSGRTPKVPDALEAVSAQLTDIEKATKSAREYVLAAEQLWKTGRLAKESRFSWVLQKLRTALPGISEEVLTDSIESGVAWLKLALGEKAG